MPADRPAFVDPALVRRGYAKPRALLDLPGEVVSGHPDRHVVRVALGAGRRRVVAYLKRQHRVPARERLANAWAGFGFVSDSVREARLLAQLRAAGIPVPPVLAFGEHGGRAFLLVRALRGFIDLREFLRASNRPPWQRRRLARRLGRLLARVHAAGFDLPDLLSKHVLVHPRTLRLALIDWPRSRRRPLVSTAARVRDLALLHASLADGLAAPVERLACLRAYVADDTRVRPWSVAVCRDAEGLLARRAVRELRQPPRRMAAQRLRWIESDESLCVTREFWRRGRGVVPDWLRAAARDCLDRPRTTALRWFGFRVVLWQAPPLGRLRRLFLSVRRRRAPSPTVRAAGLIFRLQRFGVPTARLLAFGGRVDGAGFLLTRPISDTVPLAAWLASPHLRRPSVLRRIGALLRRLHDAGCALDGKARALHVRVDGGGVVVASVDDVRIHTLRTDAARARDLRQLLRPLGLSARPGDAARVVRAYLGDRRKTPAARRLARAVLA